MIPVGILRGTKTKKAVIVWFDIKTTLQSVNIECLFCYKKISLN